jgi:hypothetical protein
MPDQPQRLPRLGFAGFENSSAAAGTGRRKSRWALRPTDDGHGSQAADVARFVSAAEICAGLGKKQVNE